MMQIVNSQNKTVLKPLVLCCLPERDLELDTSEYDLPKPFCEPEAVVSYSAQQRGWGRALAQKLRVYYCQDKERLFLKLAGYDLLLVNPLSLNTLAKFALGIQDSLPTELLWHFSAAGKPILLNESCLPKEGSSLNPHLIKIYKRYWQTVIEGNVAAFTNDNLALKAVKMIRAKNASARAFAGGGRVFITKDDIIAASESLEPLCVPYGAIITDAAQEEANERGVVIIRE